MPDTTSDAPLTGGALLDSLIIPGDTPVVDAPVETPEAETSPPPEPTDDDADKQLEEAQARADAENAPNNLDLRSSRGKTIYGHHKAIRAVTQALGFEPTPEDMQTWYTSHADYDAMMTDLTSAKPENIANFIQNAVSRSPDGVATLAGVLPEWLAQQAVRPDGQVDAGYAQMYSRLANPILYRKEQALYSQAEAAADPELKRSLAHAAKVLEWQRTGRFRQDAQPGAPAVQTQPDPYAAQVARLQRENEDLRQAHNRQSQTQAQVATQAFIRSTNAAIHAQVLSVADDAMAPVKSAHSPEMYEILRDSFVAEIVANIPRNAPDRYREYFNAYERAERAPSSESSVALARMYNSMFAREAQSLRAKYLKMATTGQADASAQKHAALARAASQVSPTTASSAAPRIVPTTPAGATSDEIRKSKLDQILG